LMDEQDSKEPSDEHVLFRESASLARFFFNAWV
jgi:hypothetical protein